MRKSVDAILRWAIIAIFTVLVACVVWQVASRFIFGVPSTVTDELARFLFMWVALIGGAYTLGQGRHLAIDLLPMLLTGTRKLLLELLILALIMAFAGLVMIYGGTSLVLKTLASGQMTPSLQIPMGYVYGAIPFSGAVMIFYCLTFAGDLLSGKATETDTVSAGPLS
ncbi:TRAP transporter small permease [Roseibium suaedae]|uniref:TRAP transporter small permease protein n=1 Tax=Roseibium suaedae TaxID=735517 RepID=A0A1M7HDN7_9HYPH|nr:TRAP transporter small permease [Roseibium suaedae]SHM26544.1 TRAP-type C4-dicarboxylate transport system, small permease component [Roseibium suaedae]